MAKSIFQKAADAIRAFKTPTWLKEMLGALQDLMIVILKKAGEDYLTYLETLIIEVAGKKELSSKQKFEYVFENARKTGISAIITLKDNELNALINHLYAIYKKAKGE